MAVSITKRRLSNGRVRYRAQVRLPGRKALSKTFSTKRAALDWGRKTEDKRRQLGATCDYLVRDAIERYRAECWPRLKPSGRTTVARQLDWWDREIGSLALADLSPVIIADSLHKLSKTPDPRLKRKRSGAVVNRYHSAISVVLTAAQKDWHWIEQNVSSFVRRRPESKGRNRFLSDDERDALLAACQVSHWPALYPLVLLALTTGARRSELLGLTWNDIDLSEGMARLRDTKNGQPRLLPIRGPALPAMRELHKSRRADCDLAFPNRPGTGGYELKKPWANALRLAKIEDFRFHDLRHSCASYLAMNGASLLEIADVLGHKTLQMVQRYSHLSVDHKASVIEKMTDAVFSKPNECDQEFAQTRIDGKSRDAIH